MRPNETERKWREGKKSKMNHWSKPRKNTYWAGSNIRQTNPRNVLSNEIERVRESYWEKRERELLRKKKKRERQRKVYISAQSWRRKRKRENLPPFQFFIFPWISLKPFETKSCSVPKIESREWSFQPKSSAIWFQPALLCLICLLSSKYQCLGSTLAITKFPYEKSFNAGN